MKAKGSRVCSGAIVLFVFVCLLLAGAGRVLVRASGTEALIRVMVEAKTESEA